MTRQPSKQRKQTQNAPLHERQKQVRATLSGDLREEYGQRSVRVNVGDTVADGEEVPRPLDSSNLRVVELDLEDELREARLQEGEDNE